MSKRPQVLRAERKIIGPLSVVNPNAAGIDAGSGQHFVSVPEDRTDEPIRAFGTFTEDLERLADWLAECGIDTVAIEATGVYWIPLFEVLEQRGLNPKLVDSRSIGRRKKKTDVIDCQWIRQLHTYGLLDGAFRPAMQILPLRAFMRQRQMLIDCAADHIRHMQKALDLMNLKLHLVISDITGVSGMRIIDAILDGKRDPQQLASMREPSCKNSVETIAKALMGNYRDEHVFALRQAVELYRVYRSKIVECNNKIAQALSTFEKRAEPSELAARPKTKPRKNQPTFDARGLIYQMAGVDLTTLPGLQASSVLTIVSETGLDPSAWPTGAHYASWLALCPNKPVTGGKALARKVVIVQPNRAAQAFRLAAQTLERAKCALGAFFRRICARHGRCVAIEATAHKLATIFYAMLSTRTAYREPGLHYYEQRYRERLVNSLQRKAAALGLQLIPVQEVH
jgi:transposase